MIHSEGLPNAKIMIVGECWSEADSKEQKPFQGQAGKVLDGILQEIGVPRGMCLITNVIHEKPKGSFQSAYYEKVKNKKQPTAQLTEAYDRLKNEIVACNPNVIVLLGNEAMKAVLGHGGVMDWRGSVINTPLGKVIPTLHPSTVLREWTFRPAVLNDFNRIAEEAETNEYKTTERELTIHPSFEASLAAIREASQAEWVAFDIEIESEQITCISLSWKHHAAISIPISRGFRREMWRGEGGLYTEDQERELVEHLRRLLESEAPKKIAHNGMFDCEWLARCLDIRVTLGFDTMLGFHALCLELPKSLAYLVSLYTDHPYYKYQLHTKDLDTYYRYNATDSCLTFECAMDLLRELDENNLLTFYHTYIHKLVVPLLDIQRRGVRFDIERCKKLKKQYEQQVVCLQKTLDKNVGYELNINSHKQMTNWLYKELKMPVQFKKRATGAKTPTADEEALDELFAKTKNQDIKTVIAIRKRLKIISTYLSVKLDKDKRIRCAYNICGSKSDKNDNKSPGNGTETGRLSSSTDTRGVGTNFQNIPEDLRCLFLADPGKTLLNGDLSQAEARIVAHISGETRLIQLFDEGGDIHVKNAAILFRLGEKKIPKEKRDIAKKGNHAANYGIGPRTFAKQAGIPEAEAKRFLNQYFATYPRIRLWHMQTKSDLNKTRILRTVFGRKRIFFKRWSDAVFREGLAYIPQSTVADITNQGLIKLHKADLELLAQVHDSVLLQCDDDKVMETARLMQKLMTIPIEINGQVVTIPVDIKVGKNWRDMKCLTLKK